jgi:hypothetical protein
MRFLGDIVFFKQMQSRSVKYAITGMTFWWLVIMTSIYIVGTIIK